MRVGLAAGPANMPRLGTCPPAPSFDSGIKRSRLGHRQRQKQATGRIPGERPGLAWANAPTAARLSRSRQEQPALGGRERAHHSMPVANLPGRAEAGRNRHRPRLAPGHLLTKPSHDPGRRWPPVDPPPGGASAGLAPPLAAHLWCLQPARCGFLVGRYSPCSSRLSWRAGSGWRSGS